MDKDKENIAVNMETKGSRILQELKSDLGPKFSFTPEKQSGNLRSKYGRLQKVNEATGSFPIDVLRNTKKSPQKISPPPAKEPPLPTLVSPKPGSVDNSNPIVDVDSCPKMLEYAIGPDREEGTACSKPPEPVSSETPEPVSSNISEPVHSKNSVTETSTPVPVPKWEGVAAPRRISLRRSTILTTRESSPTTAVVVPGRIPVTMLPRLIENNGIRISAHVLEHEKYRAVQYLKPGQLIWGVLAKFPFWPCMVCRDPSGLYLRQVEGKHVILQLHVRFFGPKGLRSWISPNNLLDFEPDHISDSLRNGQIGKKVASDKILAELSWAIEDAQIVAAECDFEKRAAVFQAIVEEQFARWKEDRKVAKMTANTAGVVKRRRSSMISNASEGDKKRIKLSTKVLDGDTSSLSFRSTSSSSGVSTMSKSSLDALSVSSAGLGDVIEEVQAKAPKEVLKPVLKTPETLEEELTRILKAIPTDLAEMRKKVGEATLCRNCTKDHTSGSLVQCAGTCGGTYHEHCLDVMTISFERLSSSRSLAQGSKKRRNKSNGHNRELSQHAENGEAYDTVPVIAHITGDMSVVQLQTMKAFKCKACRTGELPACFICHKPTNGRRSGQAVAGAADENVTYCSVANCGRAFHLDCLNQWPQAKKRREGFICPQHQCHLCISEDPRSQNFKIKQKLFRCLLCPTAYHLKENCMPAGTEIVGAEAMICQRHYTLPEAESGESWKKKPKQLGEENNNEGEMGEPKYTKKKKKPLHFALNVNWCFICARGGNLVCCDQCPSAFHRECLRLAPVMNDTEEAKVEKFMCEECELGRFPLYGELVWAKFSNYRWWPGVIVSEGQVPAKLNSNRRNRGEFCIKFLGTNDYGWIGRRRVFLYHDDDSRLALDERAKVVVGSPSSSSSKVNKKAVKMTKEEEEVEESGGRAGELSSGGRSGSYESSFRRSLMEARVVNELLRKRKALRQMELSKLLRPLPYLKLKVNRVVPPVKLIDFRSEDMEDSICNCRAGEEETVACGANSECLNRLLLTECNPSRCPAGKLCDNQQLQRRQYPRLDIVRTVGKGWGLISKDDLRVGDLVCEYVGELINNAEMRRRIKEKEAEKDDVYYFLTLNNNLIIDAERKGNLARFMNHSCEPNCESQKWTVNGNTRVGLFAKEEIKANTELTFNYNWESTGTNRTACECGANKCKGFIGSGMKKT